MKRLGYGEVKVKGRKVSLREASKSYPQNLNRMYNSVINGLRNFVKHPDKESKLVERLDFFQ